MRHLILALSLMIIPLSCGGSGGDGGEDQTLQIEKQGLIVNVKGNVETLLDGLDSAVQFLDDSDKFQDLSGAFQPVEEMCEPPSPDDPYGDPICYTEEPEPVDLDMKELIKEVIDFIDEGVMTDAQLEEETPTSLVYLLDPASFCASGEESGEARGDDEWEDEWEEDEADCEEFLTSIPVRISFTSPSSDDVNAEILIGEDRISLAVIQIHEGLLSIEIDLDDAREAVNLMNQEMGEEGEEDEIIPDIMSGKIRLSLERVDPGVYRLQFEIVDTLDVQVTTSEGDISIQLAASKYYLLIDASLVGKETLNLVSEIGSFDMAIPYQFVMNSFYGEDEEGEGYMEDEMWDEEEEPVEIPTVSGTASIHLAGFTSSLGLSDTDQINITKLGLGDSESWVKINDNTIFTLNLNPDDGRTMQVVYGVDSDWVYFKPVLDLQLGWNMAPVANDFEDLPDFLMDETFRILFSQGETNKIEFPEAGEDEAEVFKVVDGVLSLTSSAAPDEAVTVSTGQCFWFAEEDDEMEGEESDEPEGHPLLNAIEVGDC